MKRRLSPDAWLSLVLLFLLLTVAVGVAIQQAGKPGWPPLSSYSSAADGSRALRLWLEQSGYSVVEGSRGSFSLPPKTGLLWMLAPQPGFTSVEWRTIDRFIANGGSLVLAGQGDGPREAALHFGFDLVPLEQPISATLAQAPLFTSPVLDSPVTLRASYYLTTSQTLDYFPLFSAGSKLLVIALNHGTGHIIITTAAFPFSNMGLLEAGNPALVMNLVRMAGLGSGQVVLFDEWHHGLRLGASQVSGVEDWLRATSAGHAILFIALVIFLALLLRGRGFGRPQALAPELARRPAVEHVTALANLSRRAGHQKDVLQQYAQRLRRGLARRYHLNPQQPEADFVSALALANPSLDSPRLLTLLQRLSQADDKTSEDELVRLVAEACTWIDQHQ